MDEITFPPSPNWYLSNVMAIGSDDYIVYGSSRSITVLIPMENSVGNPRFKAKNVMPAHRGRVTCISLCSNWKQSRFFVSGAEDGILKLWNVETLTFDICHNTHAEAKETIVGAVFLDEKFVVSVGNLGIVVVWQTKRNTIKMEPKLLKGYKPLCLVKCPHKQNTVAVGTKQGVVLVLSIAERCHLLFKAHGHDTEVSSLCWCPTLHCAPLEKLVALKRSKATLRTRKISAKKPDSSKGLGGEDRDKSLNIVEAGLYDQTSGEEADESDIFDVHKDHSTSRDGLPSLSDSDKDNVLKYSLPHEGKNVSSEIDTSLSVAVESIKLTDSPMNKKPEHNEKFLEECKKLQEFMSSKKTLKIAQPNSSFLLDDSMKPDDSLIGNVTLDNPDDTFDESQLNPADESDIFDIYQEPSFYEFGHSKYVPNASDEENEARSIRENKKEKNAGKESDFLEECRKLQEMIRNKKAGDKKELLDQYDESSSVEKSNSADKLTPKKGNDEESDIFDDHEDTPINEFGQSYDKATVQTKVSDAEEDDKLKELLVTLKSDENSSDNENASYNVKDPHNTKTGSFQLQNEFERSTNNLFLASACKKGKICIWRWGGHLVTYGHIPGNDKKDDDKYKKAGHPWGIVHWPMTSLLLTSSKTAQLTRCNIHTIHGKSQMFDFTILHSAHLRGLYSIVSKCVDSSEEDWRTETRAPVIWTAAQDRYLVAFSFEDQKVLVNYTTFGAHVYDIAVSPTDPSSFAIGAGDGVVRVWEYTPGCKENGGLGSMRPYWQNVQGKVQSCAWHPTKENCLAFANSEGRVGLIETNVFFPARLLPTGLSLGVRFITWGPNNRLFASGSGDMVVYDAAHPSRDPEKVNVTVSGRKWNISAITVTDEYLCVGSSEGSLALYEIESTYKLVTTAYPHRKYLQSIVWHPKAVSTEDGISPFLNLVAVSSSTGTIVILKFINEGTPILEPFDEFTHHSLRVNKLCWSPHHNGKLLSASSDTTVLVYDISTKSVIHTLLGHSEPVMTCIWSPVEPNMVFTAGEDHSLRLWDLSLHPFQENKGVVKKKKMKITMALFRDSSEKMAGSEQSAKSSENKICLKKSQTESDDERIERERPPKPEEKMATKQIVNKKQKPPHILSWIWKQLKYSCSSVEGCRRLFQYHCDKKAGVEDTSLDYSKGYYYLKLFGTHNDVIELFDFELSKDSETLHWDGWCIVGLLKGDTKIVLEQAKEKHKLNPTLLTLASSVSHRFWKEMISAYAIQLKGLENDDITKDLLWKVGPWRCLVLLSVGNVEEACQCLIKAKLFPEAIAVAKSRHMDHIAEEYILDWAESLKLQTKYNWAAECYISLGRIMDAAVALGNCTDEESLALAATMAKYAGDKELADGISPKSSK